jgi:uncharacterized membrane protein YbhN (UPF0104 family)
MKRASSYLGIFLAILGLSLFMWLLAPIGLNTILDKIRLLGFGFLVLLLFSGARYSLRTISWRLCMERKGTPSLLRLFRIMLVGEAFNDMSPAGSVLGDTVRVFVGSKHMSAEESTTSVAAERLIYSFSVVLFLLGAVVLLLLEVKISGRARLFTWGLILCLLLTLLVPSLIISRRYLMIGGFLDRLKGSRIGWAFLERYEHRIRSFETSIHDFFLGRSRLFLTVLSINIITHLVGVGEAYFILKAIGTQVTTLTTFLVESANRVAQMICTFVPFGLGVEEGTAGATLHALGYGVTAGVSLGIIRKIRTMFWIAVGLLLATQYAVPKPTKQVLWEGST